jgi:hypothetical protein
MVFDFVYFEVTVFVLVIVSVFVLYVVDSIMGVVVAGTTTVGMYWSC